MKKNIIKKLFLLLFLLPAAPALYAQVSDMQSDEQPGYESDIIKYGTSKINACRDFDFRFCDLSAEDLSVFDENATLQNMDFDDKTIWPQGDKMPKWLNPQEIMEAGKTPGLNIKQLHAKGITGKGVGIAIIDSSLPKHAEYQGKLVLYKNYGANPRELMHGAAVASIAVGETVGVAPGADLYYFAAEVGDWINVIYKILAFNKTLPADKKISVISLSYGFANNKEEISEAVKEAEKQNIAIFHTSNSAYILSRDNYMADSNNIAFYNTRPYWWSVQDAQELYADNLCVPAGFRIIASPTGYEDYVAYGGSGSMSWAVPYYAGIYALAKQAYPALDRKTFEKAARATAHGKKIKDDETGEEIEVKYFINPTALIEHFQKMAQQKEQQKKEKKNKKIKAVKSNNDKNAAQDGMRNQINNFTY